MPIAAGQLVLAVAAVDPVVASLAAQIVVAGLSVNDVVPAAGLDEIVARACKNHIVAGTGTDDVVAGATVDHVVTSSGRDGVVAAPGINDASDDIVDGRNCEIIGLIRAVQWSVRQGCDRQIRLLRHCAFAVVDLEREFDDGRVVELRNVKPPAVGCGDDMPGRSLDIRNLQGHRRRRRRRGSGVRCVRETEPR